VEPHYSPAAIEPKWQQAWAEAELDRTPADAARPKFYALSMFPYPSGSLHMGHVRNYVITDVIARLRRMQGYRVLHPMGWDAFGLPAENAAIERGTHPASWTYQNIAQMKRQLQQLGLSLDWSREIATCSPDYYRWTQWLFLQFYRAGLAYQKEAAVNWDPVDRTVLANEQVDDKGRSWRSGAQVERKLLRQWFFKITDYAEQLLADLEELEGWPERVKRMQANWIGKSSGADLDFPIAGSDRTIRAFTTRPETIYGVTYLVLAPENPLTQQVATAERQDAVAQFVREVTQQSEQARTQAKQGIPTGGQAIHPFTGEALPIWVADYVLYEYGTGAVMGVPAHDERDFAFARQHGLPVRTVVAPEGDDGTQPLDRAHTGPGTLVNSGPFDGYSAQAGKAAIVRHAEERGVGQARVQYRLRDWLISRQRYWGVPIPIVHCPDCGIVPVPEADLPVTLPEDVSLTGQGSPLSQHAQWLNVACPHCGGDAQRETDTMDTFVDSSWYFLRYADARNDREPFAREQANAWLPVDQYVGGVEHAVMHLLYARFFTKVLRDRGLLDCDEPFQRLLTQGMVQGRTYQNPSTGEYVPPEQVDPDDPKDPQTGEPLASFYEKMSKSKYNGVDPQRVLADYGADTARTFILFKAPPEKDLEWNEADVEGQFRFLNRVWRLVADFVERAPSLPPPSTPPERHQLGEAEKALRRATHGAIQAVTEDVEAGYQFNTAVSELMKLSNALWEAHCPDSPAYAEGIETLLQLLAPFAPHITEELWHALGHPSSIHRAAWPQADPDALVAETFNLVVQVMGKTRGTIEVPAEASREELEQYARNSAIAERYLAGKTVKKTIVVPGKLVNFVVAA